MKVLGALKNVRKERPFSKTAKIGMFDDRAVRRRVDLLEMKHLRTICGVRWFE